MRVPQLNERVKEAPAHALRAMFAGIGQLLLVTDRLRNRAPGAQQQEEAPANGARPEETVPSAPAATAEPAPAPAEPAPAEPPAAEVPAPAAGEPAIQEPAAGPAPGAGLPLPNYDELTIPSLRARLRNLSAAQLRDLIEYESSHAAREDVVAMFERRIAKIEA